MKRCGFQGVYQDPTTEKICSSWVDRSKYPPARLREIRATERNFKGELRR